MKTIELSDKNFKKLLPTIVKLGINYRFVDKVKKKKSVPHVWSSSLEGYIQMWNGEIVIPGTKHNTRRYSFKKNRKITKLIREKRDDLYWKLYDSKLEKPVNEVFALATDALINYIDEIRHRKPDNSYFDHRFGFVEWIGQKNGLLKFASM